MDAYPPELVAHETPLLLVSGLGASELYADLESDARYSYPLLAENGTRVTSTVPPVTTPAGELLLQQFLKADSSGIWAGRTAEKLKSQTPAWRIRAVGRSYILPPRKANPPSNEGSSSPPGSPPTRVQTLHSPISPLSPDSPLYPDGVIAPLWLRKHQLLLPAVFVSAHELYTETNDLPLQNLKDNELIAAINSQRKPFSPNSSGTYTTSLGTDDIRSSGHRSKFVVVILSEKSILSSPRIDERLSYIKRSTNLTPNSTFFFLPALSSPVEVAAFVSTILTTLYPSTIEYYRDLSKHSRRKRNKASIPPPTIPSSRALSLHGWNLRFDFKLATFAEFRQEMDVAARNYESAYEKLLTEIFETTTSWSDRWTEARLLADITALRIIRCHLWSDHYTAAQRRWNTHIAQMTDILDRKGRGTHTYGFAAWLSRWNRCLAELLQAAELPVFAPVQRSVGDVPRDPPALYAPPEKSISVSDRLAPQDFLHHPGFYYLRAAEYLGERTKRAKRISADGVHDTYLCSAPEDGDGGEELGLLAAARREFEVRGQKRMADGVGVAIAKLKMAAGAWGEGLKELRGVAGGYRKEGWWEVLEEVLWGVVECARNSGDGGSVVVAGLELLCRDVFKERKGWAYDLGRCLDGIDTVKVRPTMVVRGGDVVSFLTATYAFASPKVHVGDSIASQLTITSSAQLSSTPVTFSELKISYEGPLKTILLKHTPSSTSTTSKVSKTDLKSAIHELHHSPDDPLPSPTSSKSFLYATTDLTLTPGETKVFELSSILREAGEAKAVCATFVFVCEGFELDFMLMLDPDDEESSVHILPGRGQAELALGSGGVWWVEAPKKGTEGVELRKRPVRGVEPGRLEILPRPPKMDVSARSAVEGDVYVDETVKIVFEAVNGEDEEAVVDVGVKILGWPGDEPPAITWLSEDGIEELPIASLYPLGTLPPGVSAKRTFTFPSPSFPADCAIEITAHYHLLSDPETPIAKPIVADMPVISPFRTSFDFSPRVHPDRWPDYFSLSELDITPSADGKERALGITQRWCLTVGISGMGESAIELEDTSLPILATAGGIVVSVVSSNNTGTTLQQGTTVELQFIIDIQKLSLEDRRSSSVDVALHLRWHRASITDGPAVTTILPVPRLPVPGSEPRVLAAVVIPLEAAPGAPLTRVRTMSTGASILSPTLPTGADAMPGVVHVEYMLENPTNYFLTFNVVMEANEEFAFSGPKQTSLQLLPVSRVALRYCLFTFKVDAAAQEGRMVDGGVWVRPGLRVVDRYFNKTLRVSPGSEGVAVDKAGLMVWVPEGEGEGVVVE